MFEETKDKRQQISIRLEEDTNCCFHFSCWFFQLGIWVFFFLMIYSLSKEDMAFQIISVIGFIIFYVSYLIIEFNSREVKYLCNKTSKGVYEKMGEYFKMTPTIQFNIKCYDEYEYENENLDENGNVVGTYKTYSSYTRYKGSSILPYYSSRDVSGPFYLNCNSKQKAIRLELTEEINFADIISFNDYLKEKKFLCEKNKYKYKANSCDISIQKYIRGLEKYNFIPINPHSSICPFNICLFILITLVGFAEIYKIYFSCYSVYHHFVIRKLISIRYDLNQNIFQRLRPRINLFDKIYEYSPNYYNYKYEQHECQSPTAEEIEKAKKYEFIVPKYIISDGTDGYKEGTVNPFLEEGSIRSKFINNLNNKNIINVLNMENFQRNNNNSPPSNCIEIKINNELPKKPKESNNNLENKENHTYFGDNHTMNDGVKQNNEEAPPIIDNQSNNIEFNTIQYVDNNNINSKQDFINH